MQDQYQSSIDNQIKQSLVKLDSNVKVGTNLASESSLLDELATNIAEATSLDKLEIKQLLSPPPERDDLTLDFDYGLATFTLAKDTKKSPVDVAKSLAKSLSGSDLIADVQAVGPYLNVAIKDQGVIESLRQIVDAGEEEQASKGTVVIDFSSPNVAKPFGVNHLRSTVIGEAIARLLESQGFVVIRDNHLGDWGTQFGNILAAYDIYNPEKDFSDLNIDEINELYIRYSQEMKTDEDLVEKGREYFSRLSQGDEELLTRWQHCVDLSQQDFDRVYQRLGVEFDIQIGEAYFAETTDELLDELVKDSGSKSVVVDEDGSIHIDGKHPVMLRTAGGYSVYAARDLSTIKFRSQTYNPNAIIYVVGHEQSTSFEAVFDVAKQLGLNKTDRGEADLEHVGFGLLVGTDGKKLSTRKGTSGKLEDLINQLEERALAEIKSRNPDMNESEAQDNAKVLSVAALVWHDLRTDRNTNVRFDPGAMLALGSGSVVDVLYSYVRSQRILANLGEVDLSNVALEFSAGIEHSLGVKLAELPEIVAKAAQMKSPHILVGYLHELSKLHGSFYEASPVIGEEDQSKQALRVLLHQAYIKVVAQGLDLLNIKPPSRL